VSNDLYFVRSGSVTLSFTNPDGRELVVNELRSGSFFGELGLITHRPRSLSAVAREKSELSIISRATFVELLDRDPIFARNLLQVVSQRLYVSTEREHALAFMDAPARLARLLLQYDEQASERGYITVSQEELARRTGLTRQTVAKILGRWRRLGWLLTGRGKIVLLNWKAIQSSE
jgi:CRP-like cAMP-binding protein